MVDRLEKGWAEPASTGGVPPPSGHAQIYHITFWIEHRSIACVWRTRYAEPTRSKQSPSPLTLA